MAVEDSGRPTLALFDAEGRPGAWLALHAGGDGGLVLQDHEGNGEIRLVTDADSPRLTVKRRKADEGVNLGCRRDEGGYLSMAGDAGIANLYFDRGPVLSLVGSGEATASTFVEEGGLPSVLLREGDGTPLFEAPAR